MLYAAASMERRSPNEIFIEGSKYDKICEVSVHKLRWIRDYRMWGSNKTEQVNARNINCTQEFMPYNGMFVPSGCALRSMPKQISGTYTCLNGERAASLGELELFLVQETIQVNDRDEHTTGTVNAGCSAYIKSLINGLIKTCILYCIPRYHCWNRF